MYQRLITKMLKDFSKYYPVLAITGPRQSGKTTLAQSLFPHLPYVSLEDPDVRAQADGDPRGFLASYSQGAIFDEVQYVPQLLSYLQGIVDASTQKGRYVLTGSQNFALSQHITQSLAGRVGMVTLLPLSLAELSTEKFPSVMESIFNGGYPALHKSNIPPRIFYPSYIQTYLERDVRQIKNISNYTLFHNFLKLCAGRVGQMINFSDLARDAGIATTTARAWLNILNASYIVFFLPPFHTNFSKRITKMPKLYFYDTGLVCALLGIEASIQLDSHYFKGALFENLVVLEILKSRLNQGALPSLYYWRDHTGHEIDLLGEWGGGLHAVEIKSSSTFHKDYVKHIQYFMGTAKSPVSGYVVYTGKKQGTYSDIKLVPLEKIYKSLPRPA